MIYIESRSTDPYRNLALEQYVFDTIEDDCFMLWQNNNSIIVGKHQNTLEEINSDFVKESNITVARRLSGGGAVYHDMGNLNFTFISAADRQKGIGFSAFCMPIQEALSSLGVPVEISGRNDMTVEGKKFSGNAQYLKNGRIMHHGTILYDSNLEVLSQALKPGKDKIESKGIKSVQSRVTNIRPYMRSDMPIKDFWTALKEQMSAVFAKQTGTSVLLDTGESLREITLTPEQNAAIDELKEKVYSQWSWNYGNSPPHTLRKAGRIEGCGKIEILIDIDREGKIKNLGFYGDFFSNRDPQEIGEILTGQYFKHDDLKAVLKDTDISQYFQNLNNKDFLSLLF